MATKGASNTLLVSNNENNVIDIEGGDIDKIRFENNLNIKLNIGHPKKEIKSNFNSITFKKNINCNHILNNLYGTKKLELSDNQGMNFSISSGDIVNLIINNNSNSSYVIGNQNADFKCNIIDLRKSVIDRNSEISIKKGEYEVLKFNEILNKGIIQLMNFNMARNDQEVNFSNGQLGETFITNLSLENCKLKLNGAYLLGVNISGVTWPKDNVIDVFFKSKDIDYKIKLRDTYRQLKAISLSSKDMVNALKFKANEMHVYFEILRYSKKKILNPRNWRSDYFELWVSKYSSKFGISIGRPLLGLIFAHLFLFILLLKLSGYNDVYVNFFEKFDFNKFCIAFNDYWILIIPFRKYDPNLNPIIDLLMRVCTGFFGYHLIRATRKYSKL